MHTLLKQIWAQLGNIKECVNKGHHHRVIVAELEKAERRFAEYEEVILTSPSAETPRSEVTDDYESVAEFLNSIGWKSPNDAQWTRLRDALPELAALVSLPKPADVGKAGASESTETGEFEESATCAECGVKLELVRPGKFQHPSCGQAETSMGEGCSAYIVEKELGGEWTPIRMAKISDFPNAAYQSTLEHYERIRRYKPASPPTAGKESESIPLQPKALAAVACLDKAGMDSDNSHDLADRFAATHSLETELNRLVYEALLQSHTYGSAKTMQTFIDFPGGKNVSVPLEPNEDIIDVIRSVELCDWEISPNDPGTVAHVGEVSAVYIYRAITKHFTTPPIATQDKAAPSTIDAGTAKEIWVDLRAHHVLLFNPCSERYTLFRQASTQNADGGKSANQSSCTDGGGEHA